MAKKGVFPALQADDAWVVTPSDTVNVVDDENNPESYAFCFLHNPSTTDAIAVRVLPASAPDNNDRAVTIAIPATGTFPLAVKRVYATTPTTAEGDVIGFVSSQRI